MSGARRPRETGRAGWIRAAAAILLLCSSGGGLPLRAEDPLARALVEQRERAAANPGDPRVQNDLGNLLALIGDLEGAEAAYRAALALDRESATSHYNLGRLLLGRGERWAARRQLKRAIDLDPQNGAAHYYLAAIYDAWGLESAARRRYARAFRIDPLLADPARNPHVLGNRQALAAQLLVWSNERIPGPTRQYEQPRRIASDALGPPPAQHHEPDAPTAPPGLSGLSENPEAPATGGGYARSIGAPPREKLPPPEELGPLEIDADSLNQKSRAGARDRDSRGEQNGRVLDVGSLGRRPVNQLVAPGGGPGSAARPQPPRGRGRQNLRAPDFDNSFDPGLDSTGAIERSLEPADPQRFAIAA